MHDEPVPGLAVAVLLEPLPQAVDGVVGLHAHLPVVVPDRLTAAGPTRAQTTPPAYSKCHGSGRLPPAAAQAGCTQP